MHLLTAEKYDYNNVNIEKERAGRERPNEEEKAMRERKNISCNMNKSKINVM